MAETSAFLIASMNGSEYRPANDGNLLGADWRLGAITGGICRASGEYAQVGQVAENAFDFNPKTKWLEPSGANALFPAWLEYRLVPDHTAPAVVASYYITSANDHPERDPRSWVLEGVAEVDENDPTADFTWQILDVRDNVSFSSRFQKLQFTVSLHVPCFRWRLRISATKKEGNKLQLACWSLWKAPLGAGNCCSAYLPEQTPLSSSMPPPGDTLSPLTAYVWRASHPLGLSPLSHECACADESKQWRHPLAVGEEYPAWVEVRVGERSGPMRVAAYRVSSGSARDRAEDPAEWVLEGVPAATTPLPDSATPSTPHPPPCWVKLHQVNGVEFDAPDSTMTFKITPVVPCYRVRFRCTSPKQLRRGLKLGGLAFYVSAESAVTSEAPIPSSPWVLASDSGIHYRLMSKGRLVGGICRASGEHAEVGELTRNVFDGNPKTKWLDPGGANDTRPSWIEYSLMPDAKAVRLASYSVTSANDHPERDPASWVLEGLPFTGVRDPQSCVGWVALDVQEGGQFTGRHQVETFAISPRLACTAFRLRINRTAAPTCPLVQLSCLNLFVEDSVITMQDIFA